MASVLEGLADLPSYSSNNFSRVSGGDQHKMKSKANFTKYVPTHDRTLPGPDQVISTEATNVLVRQFYLNAEKSHAGVSRHQKRPPGSSEEERRSKAARGEHDGFEHGL